MNVHGYDDAVRGRTALVKASAKWAAQLRDDLTELNRERDLASIARHAAMRGETMRDDKHYPIAAVTRRWHAEDRRQVREAPLVYLSPGILDRFDSISDVVEDLHVLPFAEPILLWFARPLASDPYEGELSDVVDFTIPLRCALVRPSEEENAIYYHTITSAETLRDIDPRAFRDDEEALRRFIARGGEYISDLVGRLTCGRSGSNTGNAAAVVAKALNAMSVREARMSEAEAPERRDRKNAKREGVSAPGDVHVIYLPRERGKGHVPGEAGDGDPRRRHRVRAHWRRQPYGPRGAGQWRWKRVEAHERGKGPVIEQETVYTTRGAGE